MSTKGKQLSYPQRRAIELWIEGGRKSKADALRKAGYSNAVVRQPHKVFNSPLVRQELEILGYGESGMENRKPPKAVILNPERPEQELILDISSITDEQIESLAEQLANTPPRNPIEPKIESNTSIIPTDPNCNVFGEQVRHRTQQGESMSAFSSM